ncbi:hypothetical protein [Acidihalobacter prosperus]
MNDPVIIIGVGEIGGVLAKGFLRAGHPVYPVTRDMNLATQTLQTPEPALVVVAVGEQALHPVLETLPPQWRQRCLLLQNELLPENWLRHDIDQPTVMSVWFEKKPGKDVKQIIPTPVYGPEADITINALKAAGIKAVRLGSSEALLFELVLKNLYILTTNICGLEVGGDVGALRRLHPDLLNKVAYEVLLLQEALTGQPLHRNDLLAAMQTAFTGDPTHQCQGRSAAKRLQRVVELGNKLKLNLPLMNELATRHLQS